MNNGLPSDWKKVPSEDFTEKGFSVVRTDAQGNDQFLPTKSLMSEESADLVVKILNQGVPPVLLIPLPNGSYVRADAITSIAAAPSYVSPVSGKRHPASLTVVGEGSYNHIKCRSHDEAKKMASDIAGIAERALQYYGLSRKREQASVEEKP